MTEQHAVYAITYNYDNPQEDGYTDPVTVAIVGMDGSVWADWEGVEKMATAPIPFKNVSGIAGRFLASTLLAARGTFPEVSKDRAREIALDYGSKIEPFSVDTVILP